MPGVVIENPILNSLYVEPTRHFRFSDDGITDEIVEERRPSSYFIPIPRPKMKGKQLTLETLRIEGRLKKNAMINRIRDHVGVWRTKGLPGVTATTRKLLDYWIRPDRERPLFFCQVEALETAIYLAEAADRQGMSADQPYDKLKRALRWTEGAWAALYRNESRPFSRPKRGQIAVKVINHYGDEVLKVFGV